MLGSDLLTNYRAGTIRALVCGVEAQDGDYSVLRNLCSLVEESLKVKVSLVNFESFFLSSILQLG